MSHGIPPADDRAVSRRQLILSGVSLGGATAAYLTFGTKPASAVTIDGFSVDGDEATLTDPPSQIILSVSGGYEITGPSGLEQARVVLQILINDKAYEPDEYVAFDNVTSGEYSVSGDLLGHPEISADSIFPDSPGNTNTVPFTARVILLAVRDADPVAEDFAEDSDELVVNSEGYSLGVGGSGSVEIKGQERFDRLLT